MKFKILDRWDNYPENAKSQIFLTWDNWNDYSFYTLFGIFYVNEKSEKFDLGNVKIGHLYYLCGMALYDNDLEIKQKGHILKLL